MSGIRGGLAALVATAAMIAPAALAAPAHANTNSGCTVTPRKPVYTNTSTSNGTKKIEYKIDITCSAGRSVYVTQQRWEEDDYSADDLEGTTHYNNIHFSNTSTITKSAIEPLPTDGWGEGDNYAEVYQRVTFHVVSDGNPPVTSGETAWEYSPVASIRE